MSAAVTPAKASRVAPGDLVLDENVRRTVRLDAAFKKSIATRGVRIPIIVRYDPLGQLLVVEGQRRTLAAIEAGLPDVPVVLVDDIADDASRIVEQLGANHPRAPVEHADDAAAIKQLSTLFGWSPTKITKELSRTKDDVNAALALADAPEETRAVVAAASIDLVTAARIADVAGGRADVAEKLTRSAVEEPGQIEHRLEQERREVEVLDAIDAKKAELVAAGVRILDEQPENAPRCICCRACRTPRRRAVTLRPSTRRRTGRRARGTPCALSRRRGGSARTESSSGCARTAWAGRRRATSCASRARPRARRRGRSPRRQRPSAAASSRTTRRPTPLRWSAAGSSPTSCSAPSCPLTRSSTRR